MTESFFKDSFSHMFFLGLIFVLTLVVFSTSVFAQSSVNIINSQNWADVYSASLYSSLKGEPFLFLTTSSLNSSLDLLNSQVPQESSLHIYSSKNQALLPSLKNDLENNGWSVPFELKSDFLSLQLDPHVQNYYILWDQQPSLSLPLLNLAKQTHSWVFIVSQDQVKELSKYLKKIISSQEQVSTFEGGAQGTSQTRFTLVGDLPLSMHKELDPFISTTINEGSTQKTAEKLFSLEMDQKNISQKTSVFLVSGKKLERDMFLTKQPLLLVSDSYFSEDLFSFLTNYSLTSFSLAEGSLLPFVQQLKNKFLQYTESNPDYDSGQNVSFFIKFAQSVLNQEGKLDSLNTFPLPEADINLTITSVDYNPSLNQLLVYIKNEGRSNAYLFASIDIFALKNKTYLTSVGSTSAQEIGPLEKTVLLFNTTIDADSFSNLGSKIFLAYGESKKQLDKHLISKETGLSPIYFDVGITSSEMNKIDLDVSEVLYRSDKNAFEIVIKNPEEINLEGVLRVQNVLVDGISKDFSQRVLIPSKRSVHLVPADLSSKDQDMNKNISLEIQYKKSGEKYIRFLHVVDEFSVFTVIPLIVSALLTFLIIIFFEFKRQSYRRKEKKSGIRWVKK